MKRLLALALALAACSPGSDTQHAPLIRDEQRCEEECKGGKQAKLNCFCRNPRTVDLDYCELERISTPGCLPALDAAYAECERTCGTVVRHGGRTSE